LCRSPWVRLGLCLTGAGQAKKSCSPCHPSVSSPMRSNARVPTPSSRLTAAQGPRPAYPPLPLPQLPDAVKRSRADTVLETNLGAGFTETRAQLSGFLETTVARYPEHWERWRARRPAGGKGSVPRGEVGETVPQGGQGESVPQGEAGGQVQAHQPATEGASIPRGGAGGIPRRGAGGHVRCLSFDLDETCWPTTPPIMQVRDSLRLQL
jgi:hypothetical protein